MAVNGDNVLHRHHHVHDGMLRDEEVHLPPSFGHLRHHFPLHILSHKHGDTDYCEVHSGKDKVQIKLDLHHYSPEEITVKAVDNTVVVEAKHAEKKDEHGFTARTFLRRYLLPDDINPNDFDEKVLCELSLDGVLTVTIPRPGQ